MPHHTSSWATMAPILCQIGNHYQTDIFFLSFHLERNKTCLFWLRMIFPLMNRPTDSVLGRRSVISRCPRLTDPCFRLPVMSWQGATQQKPRLADSIKAEPTHSESHQKTLSLQYIDWGSTLEMGIFELLGIWFALMLLWSK